MPADVTFTQVSAGKVHSLALDANGNAWAWGDNLYGQLGNAGDTDSSLPVAVSMPEGVTFTQVSAGDDHSLALDANGNAWAWGRNQDGQLGEGTTEGARVPVPVGMPAGEVFTEVHAGGAHSLALAESGHAWAWGYNFSGQLGTGEDSGSTSPVAVSFNEGAALRYLSAGETHSLALDETGSAWSWGNNTYGRLGNGSTAWSKVPVAVIMP